MRTRYFPLWVMLLLLSQTLPAQYQISGQLKKWHKVTLTFSGPSTSESATPNPFLDYRLNVTFTHGSKTYEVPGYYAADGNAAETGATSGNKWRVHFTPDEVGTWNFKVSFRQGSNVAVASSSTAGSPVSFNGAQGSFSIANTDKSGRDHRGKGRLQYVGKRYLRYAETGEYFIKTGADSPENFLAYDGFDNTTDVGGRRKSWSPHEKDFNSGDPTWRGGKGKGIIGAVNYLSEQGQNAFSFLTLSYNGDDENVFPWASKSDHRRYDVSKLDQWEKVFEHADKMGMFLHFKTQETENDQMLDNGSLGISRKLYYRELIARFSHHLALNWNLGEENTNSDQQRRDFAQYFYQHDPYRHHIVVHTYPSQDDAVYSQLIGNQSRLTGASLQTGYKAVHRKSLRWIEESEKTGKPWVVASDETGPAGYGVPANTYTGEGPTHFQIRHLALWGNLMAGGMGVEYYFGYKLVHSDLTCEDFRSRSKMWAFNRHAASFFRKHLPYWNMKSRNDLIGNPNNDNGKFCLAQPGEVYAIYLAKGSDGATLDLGTTGQAYSVRWYDPRNGGSLKQGSITSLDGSSRQVSLGNPPSNQSGDWVILVRATTSSCPTAGTACDDGNPDTINDVEDGNCNCEGEPAPQPEPEPTPEPDCPVAGTACDDGNPDTINDVEDGNCNCEGEPAPQPEPEPTPDPVDQVSLWFETECALVGGAFTERSGTAASNDKFLEVTATTDLKEPPSGDYGQVTLSFNVPTSGTYRIFLRSYIVNDDNNSLFVSVDGGPWITWNGINATKGSQSWQWDQIGKWTSGDTADPLTFSLSAGAHTLSLGRREQGILIDKVNITTSSSAPTGLGGDAPNCGVICAPAGTACDDGNPNTINDVEDGDCNCEGTACPEAGTTCDDGDPSTYNDLEDGSCNCIGTPCPEAGTTCDDGDPNTINDVEDGNCNCEGEPAPEPECPVAGTACDDGDPNTVNDVEDGNCNCEGEPAPVEDEPATDVDIFLEAECGDIGGDWAILDYDNASNNILLQAPGRSSLYSVPSGSSAQVSLTFDVPIADVYQIFARVRYLNDGDDSFWVRVDQGEWLLWNRFNSNTQWLAWDQVGNWDGGSDGSTPVDFQLDAGQHTVSFAWRESMALLDKIYVTNGGTEPSGLGGDATVLCDGDNTSSKDDGQDDFTANSLWLEAECADHIGYTWDLLGDALASNGYTLRIPPNTGQIDQASDQFRHFIEFKVKIAEAGAYKLFARTITRNDNKDSFWFSIDQAAWKIWPLVNNQNYSKEYQWDRLATSSNGQKEPVVLNLSEGTHSIRLGIRESDIFLDKLFLTNTEVLPSGLGGNSASCGVATLVGSGTSSFQLGGLDEGPSLKAYPNPTVSKLTVEYRLPTVETNTNSQVLIQDVAGRTLLLQEMLLDDLGRFELDVSNLSAGTYFLILSNGETRLPKRFIKID